MSVTGIRRTAQAGYVAAAGGVAYEAIATVWTAINSLPFHPIHFAIADGKHVAIGAAVYFIGVRPMRYFYRTAKGREIPRSSRKALAR
jgi:hypothetical protein